MLMPEKFIALPTCTHSNRRMKRILNRPSTNKTTTKRKTFYAKFVCPITQTLSTTIINDIPVTPSIARLFSVSSPPAIFRRVTSVVINTLNRSIFLSMNRTMKLVTPKHITFEVFKTLPLLIKKIFRSVQRPLSILARQHTPITHTMPNSFKSRTAHVVEIIITLFMFVLPAVAAAQIVPAQNQQIIPPYGGWIVATSSSGISKLSASTTPFFNSFYANNGTITNLTVGTCTGCSSTGAQPFTYLSNYGVLTAATSSILWAQNGIFASTTSVFQNPVFQAQGGQQIFFNLFSPTASRTFTFPDASGVFCLVGSPCDGSGTVTQINTIYPIQGGPITTTGTLTFGGLGTTSPWIQGQVVWVTNNNTVASAATGTVSGAGGVSVTAGQSVIGTGLTISCATCLLSGNRDWLVTGSPAYLTPTSTIQSIGVFGSSTIGNGTAQGGLTVNGNATTTATSTFFGRLILNNNSIYMQANDPNWQIGFNAGGFTKSLVSNSIDLVSANNADGVAFGKVGQTPVLEAQNTGIIYINNALGISTSSPANKLDVFSLTKAGIGFTSASGPTFKWTIGQDKSDAGKFKISSSSALGTNDRVVVDGNGFVGIGTTTPWKLLSVGTANTGTFAISTSSAGCATFSSNGELFSTGSTCGSGSASFPFTPTTNFGALTNATGTPLWFQAGFQSSTTGYVTNLDFYPPTSTLAFFRGQTFIKATTTNSSMSIGINAGLNQSAGPNNLFIGPNAGRTTTTGGNSVYIGFNAGFDGNVNNNIGIGSNVLASSSAGSGSNSCLGTDACSSNTTGGSNVAFGRGTLDANTTGSGNVGIGDVAMSNNLVGSGNVAIGQGALSSSLTSDNLSIGNFSGSTITTGYSNLMVGNNPNGTLELTTGYNNIIIGNSAHAISTAASNFLNIGGIIFGNLPATTSSFAVPGAAAIGIGTPNPTEVNANARLTVTNTGAVDIVASSTDNTTLSTAILEAYAPGSRVFIGAHGTNQITTQYGITVGGYGEIGAMNSSFGSSNGLLIGTRTTATPIVFGTNSLERMRIQSGGNVGVATTSPFAKFSVHALSGETNQTLFAIGSSTASATTTLLLVNNRGNLGISSSTPWGFLSVQGDASRPYFSVANSAATPVFNIMASGAVTVGEATSTTITQSAGNNVAPAFQIAGPNASASSYLMMRYSADTNAGRVFLLKSRGTTFSSFTSIAAGDRLGEFSFGGTNGSGVSEGARITAISDATPAAGDTYVGTDLQFQTSDAGATISSKMTIDSSGNVTLAGAVPAASSCGASPTVRTGSAGSAGMIIVGSGVVSACTLTFDTAYARAPSCVANFNLAAATATVLVASTTASTLVLRGSTSNMGGGFINYLCFGI